MKVLVWQDHGNVRVLSGTLAAIKEETIRVLKFYYSCMEIDLIASCKTEARLEQNVRNITQDDEMFEVFEFVDITEL